MNRRRFLITSGNRIALSAVAIEWLRDAPPDGAKWARSLGCGVIAIDEEPQPDGSGIACGRAALDHVSRRFLQFLTAQP